MGWAWGIMNHAVTQQFCSYKHCVCTPAIPILEYCNTDAKIFSNERGGHEAMI